MTETYSVIRQLANDHAVWLLCETLGASRSAYYSWHNEERRPRQREDDRLKPLIHGIFWEHKRRAGARRISEELVARGYIGGRRRVGRLMHEMKLVAIQPRAFKPRTTDSRHTLGYNDNLLLNATPPNQVNQLWVGDITYIPLVSRKFLYLAVLMDRYSRRIISWELQDHMRELLVLATLRAAIAARQPKPGLLHHTDRGGQYAGIQYRKLLDRAGMKQSMSRAADCYDNAFMESCFGSLKTELEMIPYQNSRVARKEVTHYIRYYNTRRRHSGIGYMSPAAFEDCPR